MGKFKKQELIDTYGHIMTPEEVSNLLKINVLKVFEWLVRKKFQCLIFDDEIFLREWQVEYFINDFKPEESIKSEKR